MDTVPLTVASKKIDCLEINLAKEVKELYNENLEPQKNQIKTVENEDILCSLAGRFNIVKNNHSTKYRFSAIPIKSAFCSSRNRRKLP